MGSAMQDHGIGYDSDAENRRRAADGAKAEPKPRGRQRSELSERAILSAVIHLLREKPLRDISIEEIARRAGVGKATIYKWWPSKAYVALDAFSKKLTQMVPVRDTGCVEKDIKEQLCLLFAFFDSPAGKLLTQFIAEAQIDAEFASLLRERFLKPRREAVGVIFDRAVERGQISYGLDREIVLDMIYGPGFYRLMTRRVPLGRKEVDAMVSTLFRGLQSVDRSRRQAPAGRGTSRRDSR
jgi:AcrR family transcriptional regulator